jgi:hypothetical protein
VLPRKQPHYDIVPGNIQEQIKSKAKLAADEDE